jgi:ABC-type bacteriocin/lantibiotic exporter with double-glycine peptidase domain
MAKAASLNTKYELLAQNDGDAAESGGEHQQARAFPGCPGSAVPFPEAGAPWLSRLWFLWVDPLVKLGTRTHLLKEDFWAIDSQDASNTNFARFDVLWKREEAAARRAARPVDILRPIITFARPMIVRTAALQVISVGCKFLRPLLLQQILLLVEGEGAVVDRDRGWVLALALFLTTVVDFLCSQHQGWQQYKQQVRVRAAVLGLLYRQLAQLSCGTKSAYSSGKITNMMDTDQSVLQTFTTQLNALWLVPLTFALALFMVLQLLGWSGMVAVVCMVALAPVSRKAIEILRKWKKVRNIAADARLKNLTEVMQGVRIIKFMNWEASFSSRIDALRKDEVEAARMAAVTRSVYVAYAEFQPLVILIVSLATYSLVFGQTLTASLAFPLLNYLMLLRDPVSKRGHTLPAA